MLGGTKNDLGYGLSCFLVAGVGFDFCQGQKSSVPRDSKENK